MSALITLFPWVDIINEKLMDEFVGVRPRNIIEYYNPQHLGPLNKMKDTR